MRRTAIRLVLLLALAACDDDAGGTSADAAATLRDGAARLLGVTGK